ncbi:MAG: hypothetical protein ACRD8Z_20430, partial [Nitrososphaeraceae archaeon]
MNLDHAIHKICSIVAGVSILEELYLNEASYNLCRQHFRIKMDRCKKIHGLGQINTTLYLSHNFKHSKIGYNTIMPNRYI